ncbi:MAG: ferritin-like domain-containing protein [Candidatus Bathyarchaeota archaeon]|nr:ferritin-like domain-containing protein [Candidatus Bathyarchaeota archaeon]
MFYVKFGEQMDAKSELLEFIKRQIEIEKEIVNSIDKALKDMQNPAVKGVLRGISLDSLKHADMYASALTLLTAVQPALSQEQLDKHKSLIEKHIRIEAELIKKISDVLPTIENEKVKLLLSAILHDERRHHELLKQVLEILIRGETITENDWWDILWKNVPFHGAPGG